MPYKADPWYTSKRIYAGILMIAALIASLFGYHVSEDEQAALADILVAIGTGVAAVLAIVSKILERNKIKEGGE